MNGWIFIKNQINIYGNIRNLVFTKRFVYWLASTGFSKVSIIIIDFSLY